MSKSRIAAILWLLLFSATALYLGKTQTTSIESHSLSQILQPGFDAFGRNVLGLTLLAAYRSFQFLLPMALGLIGVSLLLCFLRFFGGRALDFTFRSVMDTLTSLPGLLIALAISSFFDQLYWAFVIACGISLVPYLIRFYEGQITELQSRPYYLSTIAIGARPAHLYWYYVIPELCSSTVSVFPFLMTRLILIETSFSFLGIQSFTAGETWGRLLYQGKDYLLEAPWIIGTVGAPLFLTLLAFHLLSDPERN